ncbi:MAG TPA: peptidylprolyl isomerase [Acidimicrobiales bacterium]|nr:peptidylprolyl isomerase [Acidimicrobiales bacterium]
MKRLLTLCTLSIVGLGGGLLASACNVTPPAATVNGTTVSVSSLNDQLRTFDSTQVGRCLLTAETGQITPFQTAGAGGSGTYDMAFADSILENTVGNQLASQLAASKGLTITAADLQTAQQNFEASLSGEISAAAQQASQSGTGTYCVATSGQALTGTQVMSALPASIRNALIANNAVDEKLLADGANISDAAIASYYAANQASFTTDCVSWIVTGSQDLANSYVAQIKGGAAFADIAKANSLDTQTAPNGGSLGCTFTQSQVLQALQISSAKVGTPIGPIQDPSSGAWEIYAVTSQTVAPLSQVRSGVIQQLLQTSANGNRIAKEIQAFARRSAVSIDPQYGQWKNQGVVAPVAPPAKYLLASVTGQAQPPLPTRSSSNGSGSSPSTSTSTSTSTTAPTPTTTIPSSPTSTTSAASAAAAAAAAAQAAAVTTTTTTPGSVGATTTVPGG